MKLKEYACRIARPVIAIAMAIIVAAVAGTAFGQGTASIYSSMSGSTLDEEFGEDSEHYFDPSDFALDAAGEYFYVVGYQSETLMRVKADGSRPSELVKTPFKPTKVALFPDGKRLAVVGGDERGQVAIYDLSDERPALADSYPVGHSPTDVAVKGFGDDALLYVANCFSGTIQELKASSGEETRVWEAGREPYAIELTPDGGKLVVVDRITNMPANRAFSCAEVRIIDLSSGEQQIVELLNGHNLLQDLAISSDGKYAFIPCVQCSYLSITSQVSGGWISENCVLCVDVEKAKLVEIFFLDDAELGSGNPWGVAISSDGERLIVSIAGTDEVTYLPFKRLVQMVKERPEWARPGYGAYTYQTFAKGEVQLPFRLRVKFGFKGIRQLIERDGDLYALARYDDVICRATLKLDPPFEHFPNSYVSQEKPPVSLAAYESRSTTESGKSSFVDDSQEESDAFAALFAQASKDDDCGAPLRFTELTPAVPMKGVEVARAFARLAPKPTLTMRRRGEILFHDATACFEHWLSCVTCHPDARADGFNWDLLNDGTGNLKNTKSMLLSHETPPCMISGIRADAETAVRAGFTHILFMHYDEQNACCVDEFLKALQPLPSPHLVDGELSESAKRGKALFESDRIGCATCHPKDSYFTDMRLHRVGSQDPNDFIDKFDTPTLIETWRTAPYLNTGAHTTIRELLEVGKHGVKDGRFDELTHEEQDDLIEYVLSL